MKRGDKRRRNPGRPPSVGADARLEVRLPEQLLVDLTAAAERLGVDRSTWVRLACLAALGRHVTFGGPVDPSLVE